MQARFKELRSPFLGIGLWTSSISSGDESPPSMAFSILAPYATPPEGLHALIKSFELPEACRDNGASRLVGQRLAQVAGGLGSKDGSPKMAGTSRRAPGQDAHQRGMAALAPQSDKPSRNRPRPHR